MELDLCDPEEPQIVHVRKGQGRMMGIGAPDNAIGEFKVGFRSRFGRDLDVDLDLDLEPQKRPNPISTLTT
jgi:hypothetical protein